MHLLSGGRGPTGGAAAIVVGHEGTVSAEHADRVVHAYKGGEGDVVSNFCKQEVVGGGGGDAHHLGHRCVEVT